MNKLILKFILKLHNRSYQLASYFAKKVEGGTHPKHRLTNYHQFFLDNISLEDRVLDVGCGKGELAYDVSKKAKEVIGVDFSQSSIDVAIKKHNASNIKYLVGDVTKDLTDKKFDVIILSNVLEHIENRKEFLTKIKNLAPKILIRVPMINRSWIAMYKKEMGVEWRLDNGHFTEYTLESFKKEINETGLRIEDYKINFGEIWSVTQS